MTTQAHFRRIGWFAALAGCTLVYGVLHFQVWSVASDVRKAERQIVALEEANMLLETEFLTRSSQVKLAAWNRVDLGYSAPLAEQFINNERQLAQFAASRAGDAPAPLRLAGFSEDEEVAPFPQLVSPITGQPIDVALIEPEQHGDNGAATTTLAARVAGTVARVPLSARSSARGATVRVALVGAGQ